MTRTKKFVLQNDRLAVTIDPVADAFDVLQKHSGTLWKMDRTDARDLAILWRGDEEMFLGLPDARRITAHHADLSCRLGYADFSSIDSSLSAAVVAFPRGGLNHPRSRRLKTRQWDVLV